jgi:hypothetical protein
MEIISNFSIVTRIGAMLGAYRKRWTLGGRKTSLRGMVITTAGQNGGRIVHM